MLANQISSEPLSCFGRSTQDAGMEHVTEQIVLFEAGDLAGVVAFEGCFSTYRSHALRFRNYTCQIINTSPQPAKPSPVPAIQP